MCFLQVTGQSECEMAHNLTGSVKDFVSLEHVDPGTPKTTDLDEALAAPAPSSAPVASGSGEHKSTSHGAGLDGEPEMESATNEEASSQSRRSKHIETIQRRLERFEMDKEDVVTVRYFPIKFAQDSNDQQHQKQQQQQNFESESDQLKSHSVEDDEDTLRPLPRSHWAGSGADGSSKYQELLNEVSIRGSRCSTSFTSVL